MTDVEHDVTPAAEQPAGRAMPTRGPDPVDDSEASRVTLRNTALGRAFAALATVSLRLILIVAALVLVGYALGKIFIVVFPIALALLLCTVLWPPVRFLRDRGTPPALAAAGMLLVGLALLGGLLTLLAPQVVGQTQDLADSVVGGLDDVQELLSKPPFNLDNDQIGGAVDSVIEQLQSNTQNVAGSVLDGVGVAGNLLIELLLALVLSFFFLKDGPKFLPWLTGVLGPRATPHADALATRSWTVLGAFIRVQVLVGLVDAVFIGAGLVILGVPLALPLAVLVFFGGFIPIVGAVVTGALAALVALVTGGITDAIIVVLIVLLVQQLESNVLQPLLVGRALDLHPALVLLSVTIGGTLAGITGAFLAVPVLSVAAVMVRYTREALGDPHTGPAAPASSVRLEPPEPPTDDS